MAEFNRQDIIADDALQAPLVLKKNFEDLLATMKEVHNEARKGMGGAASSGNGSGGSSAGSASPSSNSTKKAKEETDKLIRSQQELIKVQNQIATAVAKDNDEYRKQEKVLVNLKAEMKQKVALGEKEITQVTKLNSSLSQIEAALKSNRVAYANLTSEEARQSETGKGLLVVIQSQAKAQKELREELGQFSHNVGDYVGAFIKANEQIKKQEKETQDLIVAQRGLDKTTEEGKKAYDHLNVAIQNNITQINVYRKEAGMAATSTKDLDKQLESAGKSSGGLGDAVGQMSPGLKSASDGAAQFGKALLVIAASPVGIIIAGIALAVAGLARYFTATTEGQDKWNKVLAFGGALLDTFLDALEVVGKALISVIEEPRKAWDSFLKVIKPISDQLQSMWDNPLQAAKDFGDFILTNIINRFKALGVYASGIGELMSGNFKAGAKTIANASIQLFTGVENAIDKVSNAGGKIWDKASDAYKKFIAEQIAKQKIVDAITDRANQFKKDAIQDIIDDSETELQVAKDLQIVHDKLRNTDEQRLSSLREANSLLKAQSEGDVALAKQELEILKDQLINKQGGLEIGQLDYEQAAQLAALRVKVNNTEQTYYDGQKKRLAEEFTLVNEISKRKLDQIKAEQDARDNLFKWRLENEIQLNEQVLQNEKATLGEQTNAIYRINEIKVKLAEDAAVKETEIAFDAAKQRVALSATELKEIYANKALDTDAQIALEDKYRTEKAAKDEGYIASATQISNAMFAEINKNTEDAKNRVAENVFTVLERDARKMSDTLKTSANIALIELDGQLQAGLVTRGEYAKKRKDIEDKANQDLLDSQLEFYQREAALSAQGSAQRIAADQAVSDIELQMKDNQNAAKLEKQQEFEASAQAITSTAIGGLQQVIADANAIEDEQRALRSEALNTAMAQELEAAGTNESAKVAIKNKYALEQEKIRKEQAAADRKRAIFEKAAAIISIAINTALGVSKALGTYPPPASFILAAVTAALGIAQIAIVASKPIPSYAVGTDNHPGGLARVGEQGAELVTTPSGENFLTPAKSTFMDLPQGSKVLNNKDTIKALAINALPQPEVRGNKNDVYNFDKLGNKLDSLEKTVRNKKEQHWNISKQGMQAMVQNAETREYFMDQLYR